MLVPSVMIATIIIYQHSNSKLNESFSVSNDLGMDLPLPDSRIMKYLVKHTKYGKRKNNNIET